MYRQRSMIDWELALIIVLAIIALSAFILMYFNTDEKTLAVVSADQHRQLIAEVDESRPGAPEVVHSFDASVMEEDSRKQVHLSWVENLAVFIDGDNRRYQVLVMLPCTMRDDTTNIGYTVIGNASMTEEGEFRDTLRQVTFFTTIDNAMLLSFAPRTDGRIIGTTVDFIDNNTHAICGS